MRVGVFTGAHDVVNIRNNDESTWLSVEVTEEEKDEAEQDNKLQLDGEMAIWLGWMDDGKVTSCRFP